MRVLGMAMVTYTTIRKPIHKNKLKSILHLTTEVMTLLRYFRWEQQTKTDPERARGSWIKVKVDPVHPDLV